MVRLLTALAQYVSLERIVLASMFAAGCDSNLIQGTLIYQIHLLDATLGAQCSTLPCRSVVYFAVWFPGCSSSSRKATLDVLVGCKIHEPYELKIAYLMWIVCGWCNSGEQIVNGVTFYSDPGIDQHEANAFVVAQCRNHVHALRSNCGEIWPVVVHRRDRLRRCGCQTSEMTSIRPAYNRLGMKTAEPSVSRLFITTTPILPVRIYIFTDQRRHQSCGTARWSHTCGSVCYLYHIGLPSLALTHLRYRLFAT